MTYEIMHGEKMVASITLQGEYKIYEARFMPCNLFDRYLLGAVEHMMNILDYLVGNMDRHGGNWGFLIDNETGEILRLHDLMDFNQAFSAYDSVDGAGWQFSAVR